jgi:carboxyl-terminal processing protease
MSKKLNVALSLAVVIAVIVPFVASCSLVPGIGTPQRGSLGAHVLQQAWDYIHNDYVEKNTLDDARLSEAAVKALVTELHDPYTTYLSPADYKITATDLTGKFEGIGAQVGVKENKIVIIAPLPGTPAETAGIKPGDTILAVNGQSTEDMNITQVINLIRGPAGTTVNITVQHEGATQPVQIDVVRAEIKTASVAFQMRGDVAYIQLFEFSQTSNQELDLAFQTIESQKARGIILDLRNNPGGLLDTAVAIGGRFIKEGTAVTVVDNNGRRTVDPIKPGQAVTDLPLVVLVNQYSASASEVLTGMLQDYGRATIAGNKTFGKGSVIYLLPLDNGGGIYMTSGRWLTPNGRLIEGKGLDPDIVLTQQADDAVTWAIDYLHGNN